MLKIKYGNTNTFYIPGNNGGLLVDTDYAGNINSFFKAIKQQGIEVKDISYVLATHWHPDHMGLIGELMEMGVKLLLIDVQKEYVHSSDYVFERDGIPYVPVREENARLITCKESRAFLKEIGISGEIISTPSHSPDSVTLLLDDHSCFVGDLVAKQHEPAFEADEKMRCAIRCDWENIIYRGANRIYFAHWPEIVL